MDWMEEVKKLLFSLDRNELSIERAFLIKNEHLPKTVFKYREINDYSIKNLKDDTIWLADPSTFNDPYDCAHSVDYIELQKQKGKEFLTGFLSEKGGEIEVTVKQREILLSSDDPVREFMEFLLSKEPEHKRDELKSILSSVQNKINQDLNTTTSREIASLFKLCSFSEINNSMLMWAHYADYHQGFCIEYDLEHEPYSDPKRRYLFPVLYSNEMFDATAHYKNEVAGDVFNNLHLALSALMKSEEWSYEKEWRLVFPFGIIPEAQSFNMGKPKSVFLGAKIDPKHQDTITEICDSKNIPVSKMTTNPHRFELEPLALGEAEQHFFKNDA